MSDLWGQVMSVVAPFAEASQRAHRRSVLRDELSMFQARCGNCAHWMKPGPCPQESGLGSVAGGPSMNGAACSRFTETEYCRSRRTELEAALSEDEERA